MSGDPIKGRGISGVLLKGLDSSIKKSGEVSL